MASPLPSLAPPKLLGQELLSRGHLSEADLGRALALQAQNPSDRLGAILVRLGALSEENLLAALSAQTGYAVVTLADIPRSGVDAALRRLGWPIARLQALRVVPWEDAAGELNACAEDPLNASLQEAVEAAAACPVRWHFIRSRDQERLLAGLAEGTGTELIDAARYREMAEDGPVIAFVNNLIAQAIDERASDIHIEPGEFACEVRYRIDGVLHTRSDFAHDRFPAVASRIKLIAGLDIAERRPPQDGRITLRAAGAEMDMRVSVVPAAHGESIVMRLLPKQRHDLRLEALGMESDQLAQLRRWLDLPSGLVLVTGPTGSGKSTTLYAALSAVDDRTRKILTVEDPVEHRLPGIMQVQVQSEIGYTFARALRSFLPNGVSRPPKFLNPRAFCSVVAQSRLGMVIRWQAYGRPDADGFAKSKHITSLADAY